MKKYVFKNLIFSFFSKQIKSVLGSILAEALFPDREQSPSQGWSCLRDGESFW